MTRPSRSGGAARPAEKGSPGWTARAWSRARPTLLFLGAWAVLDILLNARYPRHEPPLGYLRPSLDVTALWGLFALLGWRRRPPPAWLAPVAAGLVVAARILRFSDGVTIRYFNRPIELYLDLPMAPDVLWLLKSTVPLRYLLPGAALALAAVVVTFWVARWALRRGQSYLAASRHRSIWLGTLVLLSLWPWPSALRGPDGDDLRWGPFGASVVPRLARETALALAAPERRRTQRAALLALAASRRDQPTRGLERLHGADVFLFLIESYGATVIDQPAQRRQIALVYADLERALTGAGFVTASSLLESPTYAGRSWLAQETLATGVRVTDRVGDALVQEVRPRAMAGYFRDAGYDTLLVQPGTTLRAPMRWAYDFQRTDSAWDFDYRGPTFRWAWMPDQYVVNFVHQRELAAAASPRRRFIEYALVSSHAPWSEQPALIDDWSAIGDGELYQRLPPVRFPISWTNLDRGGAAYVRSLAYDLEVIGRYVTSALPPGALVIILGDHQPVADITGQSPSAAVPIHVISRDHGFVDRFLARGYTSGLSPRRSAQSPPGMETFLPTFLEAFSEPPAASAAPSHP